MIYFDENKEAYMQLETLENWGKTCIYSCDDDVYNDYQKGKYVWEGNNLVLNPEWNNLLLQQAKEIKYNEAVAKANDYIQSGNALYEFETGKHIEATDGNIGKFTAYALAFVTGQLQPTDTVVWNTKEDETVQLSQLQVSDILVGLGQVQAVVWTVKYPAYITAINEATTVEEVEAIEINYEILGE